MGFSINREQIEPIRGKNSQANQLGQFISAHPVELAWLVLKPVWSVWQHSIQQCDALVPF
jgi:hypothetical protein